MTEQDKTLFAIWAFAASLTALVMLYVGNARANDLECETATHCVLTSFPRHFTDEDEPETERWERLLDIANGIDTATEKPIERAWLIMTAWNESRLARYVDLDWPKCRDGHGGRCDSGRAFGVTQLHGTDRNMERSELFARSLRTFKRGANYCSGRGHDYWIGGTSQYARGGYHCEWDEADKRIKQMWAIFGRIQ